LPVRAKGNRCRIIIPAQPEYPAAPVRNFVPGAYNRYAVLALGHLKKEWEMHLAGIKRRVPMGRLGTPDEVAAALDFLISECSSYITGPMIHPNGGHLVL